MLQWERDMVPRRVAQVEEEEEQEQEEQQEQLQPRQYTRSGRMVRPPARYGEMSEEEDRDTSQDTSMILSDPEVGGTKSGIQRHVHYVSGVGQL